MQVAKTVENKDSADLDCNEIRVEVEEQKH